jgi:DNA-binding NtrC family response regulator
MGKEIHEISLSAMEDMQNYSWPGNIRELENIIERAVITSRGTELNVELPLLSAGALEENKTLEEIESDYIINILERTSWKIAGVGGAAEILGMHSNTLRSRMEKLGISKP